MVDPKRASDYVALLIAIRQAIAEAVQTRFAHEGRWRVPVPAALVRAVA